MNPDDLIKAAPAIAKGAGALAAALPFTAIVKRMLGPAADEVAELWRDHVRVYRYGRQLKLLEKADRMAQEAGFEPQAIPPKILFPLLEGASFEEDEDLHTMWAALLANAADPNTKTRSQPAYADILKQLTSDQAKFLDILYQETVRRSAALKNQPFDLPDPTMLDLFAIPSKAEFFGLYCEVLKVSTSEANSVHPNYSDLAMRQEIRRQYSLAVDNLFRLRLLREKATTEQDELQKEISAHDILAERFYIAIGPKIFYFSTMGFEFIQSCRPPQVKS